jgi:hypothetical protein
MVLALQMQFAAERGDWDLVVADLKSAKTVAGHLLHCPTLIEQFVGMAVDEWASQQLMRILRGHTLPDKAHQDLALILAESFSSGYPIADVGRESLGLLDIVQRVFTDDGSGDGHLIPGEMSVFHPAGTYSSVPPTIFESAAIAMIHSSRSQTVELIGQWRKMSDRYRLIMPYQDHVSGRQFDAWFRKTVTENPRNYFAWSLLPATQRAV